jgi:hypothetical protein
MKFLLILDLLCFPGLVWFLAIMRKKGELNDKRFGLISVSYFQLIALISSRLASSVDQMRSNQLGSLFWRQLW